MPTRKIGELKDSPWYSLMCRDPEHNLSTTRVFEEGIYEHECPSCQYKICFTIFNGKIIDPFELARLAREFRNEH